MTIIKKLTNDLINKLIKEFKCQGNKKRLNNEIIDPLIFYISECISNKIYPFFIIGFVIFILTFLFSLILLILVINLNLKFNKIKI